MTIPPDHFAGSFLRNRAVLESISTDCSANIKSRHFQIGTTLSSRQSVPARAFQHRTLRLEDNQASPESVSAQAQSCQEIVADTTTVGSGRQIRHIPASAPDLRMVCDSFKFQAIPRIICAYFEGASLIASTNWQYRPHARWRNRRDCLDNRRSSSSNANQHRFNAPMLIAQEISSKWTYSPTHGNGSDQTRW